MSSDALAGLLAELGNDLNFSSIGNTIVSTVAMPTAAALTTVPVKGILCLNMIVKNESKIIERLLASVVNIVDTYCISDTGSTDDTVERIRNFMKNAGKPGEVFTEPFQNFGYNRSVALDRAATWGVYALLLDADMKLVNRGFDSTRLTGVAYSVLQKNGGLEYYNTRIVKTGVGVRCIGPTHEYYDIPKGGSSDKLESLLIEDIGDGGAKADKFERDIRLLTKSLELEPNNPRTFFYLGNSYRDVGNLPEAVKAYKRRIELGGWVEEVFYACYELGSIYKRMNDMPQALYWWLEGWQRRPCRSESLYEVTKYYRESGKNTLAKLYCDIGRAIPYPKDDVLFIKKDVYTILFEYEQSIITYYTKDPVDFRKYITLIESGYNKSNVLSNYMFYTKHLEKLGTVLNMSDIVVKTVDGREDTFTSSSPCLIPYGEGYLLNIRYVNYKIRPDGGYDFKLSDGKITTLNKVCFLHKNLRVLRSHWFDEVEDASLRYQGIEDIKVFPHAGELLLMGTVQDKSTGDLRVGHGTYDLGLSVLKSRPFPSPRGRSCEKNWCYAHTATGDLRIVYEWSPLTICSETGTILSEDTKVPPLFRDVRGSTNGCLVEGEVWFLCHLVHHSSPRTYYHLLVVLDATTLALKRHSILFKFSEIWIEYALGLVVEADRLLISYSRNDASSSIVTLTREVVEKELF